MLPPSTTTMLALNDATGEEDEYVFDDQTQEEAEEDVLVSSARSQPICAPLRQTLSGTSIHGHADEVGYMHQLSLAEQVSRSMSHPLYGD